MPDPANGKRSEGVLGKPRPSGRGGVTAEFFVSGIPRPQGNHRTSRSGHVYDTCKGLPAWRKTVAMTAVAWKAKQSAKVRKQLPLNGPLQITLQFAFPCPRRPLCKSYPVTPPDLDKCVRAVSDSLTAAGIIEDDSRIVSLTAQKYFAVASAAPEYGPGCLVRLDVMGE